MSTNGPEVRIGDAEREAAVAALGEHYAVGRLTKDEYDERAAVAWSARTVSAIRPLFVDLPDPHQSAPPGVTLTRPVPPAGTAFARTASVPARHGRRFPLLPVFLIVLAAVMVLGVDFPALLLVGGLWWAARSLRWQRHGTGHQVVGRSSRCGTR